MTDGSSKPFPVMLMVRELGAGGTERQLVELAKSLDRSRFSPHVGCFRGGFRSEELRAAGVPILRLPVQSFLRPSAIQGAWMLARYLRRHSIRIAHAFDAPLNCFGVPVARAARVPVVLSSTRAHRSLNPPRINGILRWTDHMVNGVVVNCEAMRLHLVDEEKVPASRIHLCYNGIDTETFTPASRSEGRLTIGLVSVLRPEKDVATLVEAFARVAGHPASPRLLIAGGGPMLPNLQALAERVGVGAVTRFEPATSPVVEYLRQIDIFVLPSLSEALSNSLMEAMSTGCTAVASNVGGNPELVLDDETGFLFEPGDIEGLSLRLRQLLDEELLRRRLASNGMRFIRERFTLAESARSMEIIYDTFLADIGGRRTDSGATQIPPPRPPHSHSSHAAQ
jgi:glycosyltransferase involved in cell wall biosynthesis